MIEFIFMLTRDDVTVKRAVEVYDHVRATDLKYIGFKDIGASAHDLAEITRRAHEDGLEVMLEVVSTSAEDEIRSIEMAPQIGVDWVLGGTNAQTALGRLAGSGLRYCPFPGQVVDHPSVLKGDIADIAASAKALTTKNGVHGLDLLAYRHQTADVEALTRAVVSASSGPVIAAGAVGSIEQIQTLARSGAWGFTIGTAIFEGRFAGAPDIAQQVRNVMAAARLAPHARL